MKKITFVMSILLFTIVFSFTLIFSAPNNKNHYEILKEILSYGPRPSGSKNLIKVQELIESIIVKTNFEFKPYSFTAKTPLGKIAMKNIAAIKKGKTSETIVLAAHYESKLFDHKIFLGANDGAAGTALLLDLIQTLDSFSLNKTIIILFLDGEESFKHWSESDSLYGSNYQSKIWEKENLLQQIQSFILLDMIGDEKSTFCKESNSNFRLISQIWKIANQFNYTYFKDCESTVSDDHIPFIKKNVPSIDLIPSPFPDYWHTENDTLDKISIQRLSEFKVLLIEFLNHN